MSISAEAMNGAAILLTRGAAVRIGPAVAPLDHTRGHQPIEVVAALRAQPSRPDVRL